MLTGTKQPKQKMQKYSDLRCLAIFADDHPREGVGQAGRVGADEGASLVHVSSDLEELEGEDVVSGQCDQIGRFVGLSGSF